MKHATRGLICERPCVAARSSFRVARVAGGRRRLDLGAEQMTYQSPTGRRRVDLVVEIDDGSTDVIETTATDRDRSTTRFV